MEVIVLSDVHTTNGQGPIKSVLISSTIAKAGDKIVVAADSEPIGHAVFSISQLPRASNVAMTEDLEKPGTTQVLITYRKGIM